MGKTVNVRSSELILLKESSKNETIMPAEEITFFENNLGEMLTDIRELVESESPSNDSSLLRKCSEKVEEIVQKRLGLKPEKIEVPDKSPILVFTLGDIKKAKPALLLSHYDTVHSKGVIESFPFTNNNQRLTGPGVFDMKTGLVQGIWALKYLKDKGILERPVQLMCTPDEEVGSKGSRKAIEDHARQSEYVIVLEPSSAGMIKTSRKGTGRFSIKVIGRAAHAGLEPEKGINAIAELSSLVLKIQELNRNDKETTVNVGRIRGGTATNVVPAEAEIDIDIRVWSQDEADRIEEAFKSLQPKNPETKILVEGSFDRPPMRSTEKTNELVRKVKDLSSELGKELGDTAVGGASDGNLVAPLGIPVMDGFGAVGGGAHSISEYVMVEEIPFRSALVSKTLRML